MATADRAAPDRSAPDPSALSEPPTPPAAAAGYFGDRLPRVTRLAALLAGDAVVRGLIGPRETPRLWERHLLNCAVLGELLPHGARVVDIGSGAGLPGLVVACDRADLSIDLVEPLQRRAEFLREAVEELGLADRVRVLRGRAEEPAVREAAGGASWITARAVAPLGRLATWCAPLLAPGGRLLAMKGRQAAAELEEARSALRRTGVRGIGIELCGVGVVDPPTGVVVLERQA